jgi:hypothetical protein
MDRVGEGFYDEQFGVVEHVEYYRTVNSPYQTRRHALNHLRRFFLMYRGC